MLKAPVLSDHHWALIEPYLPLKWRNRSVSRSIVSAIVFRHWSGASLRQIAEWYEITFSRAQSWEVQLRDGGQIPVIMKTLRLPEASSLMWSNGGVRSSWDRDPETAPAHAAYRFTCFRDALRLPRRSVAKAGAKQSACTPTVIA